MPDVGDILQAADAIDRVVDAAAAAAVKRKQVLEAVKAGKGDARLLPSVAQELTKFSDDRKKLVAAFERLRAGMKAAEAALEKLAAHAKTEVAVLDELSADTAKVPLDKHPALRDLKDSADALGRKVAGVAAEVKKTSEAFAGDPYLGSTELYANKYDQVPGLLREAASELRKLDDMCKRIADETNGLK
ncbi:hypothetical protein [Limnoglobus roseus]|uniref:Uncharacterized protein n=1 Tax=Limnoglobus roseus TaxID=2598579 RepID=A0A5C1AHI4_9BACT|nr:hypothetical protein [Limnoglobus roseus]QEL18899.1 hypothetical protein PX52LOC_05946 [Limnoglobus roseus]